MFLRTLAVNEQFSIRTIFQDRSIGILTLDEDLAPMCDKQKTRSLCWLALTFVVKSSDEGLAGTSRGYNEIAISMVAFSFHPQLVEHSALKRVRSEIELEIQGQPCWRLPCDGAIEPLRVTRGIVRFVVSVRPV